MATPSVQRSFGAAEQAYLAGRFAEARTLLAPLESQPQPAVHHLRALVEQSLGDLAAARHHFERAAAIAPNDPQLWNNFGNLLSRWGDEAAALAAFDRALALSPRFADAHFNRALLLRRAGRLSEACAGYEAAIALNPNDPRFWNGLAELEKAAGNLAASASAYDRALEERPEDRLATVGRARVALERDEADVEERYRAARRAAPEAIELLIDEAEARLAHGDRTALDDLAEAAAEKPDWTNGQIALARMRWEQGQKEGFADHIEALLAKEPQRAPLWHDYVQLLLACKLPSQAADVAARARRALGDDPHWMLTEAAAAGKAGAIERAEALFARLPADMPKRAINEAAHRIRQRDYVRALALTEAALAENRWDLPSWTMAELLYRQLGDSRATWLSGQPGLVDTHELEIAPADFAAVDALLLRLHTDAIDTIGQSVRGGSQTRWNLFDRVEPELTPLKSAIERGIACYVDRLPQEDDTHPLLRHRNDPLKITASWSVRFQDAGYHEPHYHPLGLLSSACYFRVATAGADTQDGWLEIGRPAPDLLMDLEPLATIEPKPGRLVLFPSYLIHGTRPFRAGERMTVAFDVAAA
ncbi:MAG: tetratricopeptide repeat protein [Sphingosinicella sp.]